MPSNGTYIDNISSRGGRDSELSFAGNFDIKDLVIDLSHAWPPEKYIYNRGVDHVYIGNHFGFQVQLNFAMLLKGSAIPPNVGFWEWKYVCNVILVYPDGYEKTGQIVLGTELINPAVAVEKDVSFPVTFNSQIIFESIQYVDYTENPDIPVNNFPYRTTLKLYEQIPMSTIQDVSVTVFGLTGGTVSENTHPLTYVSANTDYDFTIDTKIFSIGSIANIQSLSLSPLTINELALPDYNYFHYIDSNNYFHQTTAVDAKVQGTDNAFGDPVYNYIEANTLVTLERNIDIEANIHAWQDSYPDDLDINLIIGGVGNQTYTAFSGFGSTSLSFQNYSFNSNISGTTESLVFNNLPSDTSYISNSILTSSLAGNGDTTINPRLAWRGWWKPGADIYHIKNSVLPGTGNTRTYSEFSSSMPYQYFSSYRYLDITAGNATTSPQTAKLLIYGPFDNGFFYKTVLEKDITFNPGTSTQQVDLCFAGILHTNYPDIQTQDNPYPRPNSSYYTPVAKYWNQDMYGISQVLKIELVGNVSVSEYKLTRPDNTAKATFLSGVSNDSPGSNTGANNFIWAIPEYTGPTSSSRVRRFFEQDVSGRNEEEYDVVWTNFGSGVLSPVTVANFCNNIQNRLGLGTGTYRGKVHQGWMASPSGPTTGDLIGHNLGWFQPGSAYASWLNGFGLQAIAGTKTYSILRDFSQESGDRDLYSQMIFDRINSRYVPDYFDAFQVEAPGATSLKLIGFNCQRSAAHGLVQLSQFNQTVDMTSTLGENYGSATTDIVGNYQTGLPYGKAQNAAIVSYLANTSTNNKIFTSKRFRVAFYAVPVPENLIVLSADISGFYQQCIGTIDAGIVKLVFTSTPYFTSYDVLPTNITGMNNVAIAWVHPTNSNQMTLITERTSDSAILKYTLDDFINGAANMGTVIGNGTTPAIAINNLGTQIIFWRTSSSNIQRIIIDSAGNITTAASNVIIGNVENTGIGCYWNDDIPFLVYNHTTNGLTVVKSTDYGQTFS